ncbi:hypothetical protein D3C72_1953380 [compost metagenome]
MWPMEVFRLSVPPRLRLWQELHEMKPDLDRRGSKNSFLPSSTAAGFTALWAGTGDTGSVFCAMAEPLTRIAAMARLRMADGRDVVVFKVFPLQSVRRVTAEVAVCLSADGRL